MALHRLLDLSAHRFYVLVPFLSVLVLFLRVADKVGQLSGKLVGAQ